MMHTWVHEAYTHRDVDPQKGNCVL